MEKTKKCIKCLKPAICWGGHVIDDDKKVILAGFCAKHQDERNPNLLRRTGCYGGYHKRYGRE